MIENSKLKAELLNTKELSSKLVEENAALKAEVKQLKRQVEAHDNNWAAQEQLDAEVAKVDGVEKMLLFKNLTLEREITAMLREALEAMAKSIPESINTSEVEVEQTAAAQRALAREKEMRK